jgi:hypothetical protein
MKKNELQKAMIDRLTPIFKDLDFRLIKGEPNYFRRSINDDIAEVYFTVFSDGRVLFSKAILSIKIVEDVILSVGVPSMDLTRYHAGDEYLQTVRDQRAYPTDIAYTHPIKSEEQLQTFVFGIKQYMKDHGMPFIELYHYVPNILKRLDTLTREGESWHTLMGGSGGNLFRVLIISKICNDPEFEQKIGQVDAFFFDTSRQLEEWKPYYENLKEKLLNLSPKYNYEV